jgi:carboxyl-terminal processing protease
MKRLLLGCFFLVVAVAVLAPPFPCFAQTQDRDEERVLEGLDGLARLLRIIENNYWDKLDPTVLIDNAVRGMLDRLDPHSTYFDPVQTRQLLTQQEGEYYGIGAVVGTREDVMIIVSPMEDGPAARQGIRTGDVITHINGEPTEGEPLEISARKLRGPEGTTVELTIQREGMERPFDIKIIREKISLYTVPYYFIIDESVGYIRLTYFSRTSSAEVQEALENLEKAGMKSLVLDLRSNPGGDLIEAVGVADLFLDEGLIVYTMADDPDSRVDFEASGDTTKWRGPVVVMINRGSASASEVLAGALQDQDRAVLAGENSWGKGLVQNIYPLSHGAALALTTARYYTPSGRLIQREYKPGDYDEYFDPSEDVAAEKLTPALTSLSRVVYGGNGLAPDYVVTTTEPGQLFQEVILRGLVFDFLNHYLGEHPEVKAGFRADENMLSEFRAFLVDSGLEVKPEEWKSDQEFFATRLTLEVVTRLEGAQAGYRAVMIRDGQVQEALKLLPKATELLRRKMEAKAAVNHQ